MSKQAELNVVGALLISAEAFDDVADLITGDEFTHPLARHAFCDIAKRVEQGEAVDCFVVADAIGVSFRDLAEIAKNTPGVANVRHYARMVKDTHTKLELQRAGSEIVGIGQSAEKADECLEKAQSIVGQLSDKNTRGDAKTTRQILRNVIVNIEHALESDGELGLSSGFADLDKKWLGMRGGDLIILAARPSMGKTTFAMNVATHLAREKFVFISSMEMPGEQLITRELSARGRINNTKLQRGDLDSEEWTRFSVATSKINELKLVIDDDANLTPSMLRSKIRKAQRKHERDYGPLSLVVVDYLQLMQYPEAGENRVNEITKISQALKAIAKDFDVPVIALSQLNRSLENRPNKRPICSDLRDSGSIEQDADVIIFLYRDDVYNSDSPDKGTAEVIIAKQRNGELGTSRLVFRGEYCRFESLAHDWSPSPVSPKRAYAGGFSYEH